MSFNLQIETHFLQIYLFFCFCGTSKFSGFFNLMFHIYSSNMNQAVGRALHRVSQATMDYLSELERIYEAGDMIIALDKSHVYKMIMAIVGPVKISEDYQLSQSPHIKSKQWKCMMKNTLSTPENVHFSRSDEVQHKRRSASGFRNLKLSALTLSQQKKLCDQIIRKSKEGGDLTRDEVKTMAIKMCEKEDFQASGSWFRKFVNRYKVKKYIKDIYPRLKQKQKDLVFEIDRNRSTGNGKTEHNDWASDNLKYEPQKLFEENIEENQQLFVDEISEMER